MLYDDHLGFGLVAATTIIIICCFLWFILEKFHFKKKTNFADAWRQSMRKDKDPKKFTLDKNHKISFGETNFFNNNLKQNGVSLDNPNFQMNEENNNKKLNEKLQRIEDDLNFVKMAITKISNAERNKSLSQLLAS